MNKFIEHRKEERIPQKNIVVLYHADCSDGFGGAWAAWKKFGDQAEYFPVFHQQPPPGGLTGKEIYMVDFTYPEDIMMVLIENNRKVMVVDHHESREKEAKMADDYRYRVNNSGAVLAWKYFHPDKKVPLMLEYIQDVDLWKKEMPCTEEVFAFLDLFNFNFVEWNKLAEGMEDKKTLDEYVEKGKFILKYQEKLIERLISRNVEVVEFEGYKTYAVNAPDFRSELGSRLLKKLPPIAVIWYQRKNKIMVSLRSDGSVDVSGLAKKYGGGGHIESAGFVLDMDSPLPWREIENE